MMRFKRIDLEIAELVLSCLSDKKLFRLCIQPLSLEANEAQIRLFV